MAAGETDHLTPWPSCYTSSGLLGGDTRFALSTGGHIAAVIHPPGNPKSAYWLGDNAEADADGWRESADAREGSWWEEWRGWLTERSGDTKRAPRRLGNSQFKPLMATPGEYVMHRTMSYAPVG